jgi:hypothetical protein
VSKYVCTRVTHLKFDIFPDFYRQNRGGSKLTRGSSQVNLTLIETETRVQTYFDTPFLNLYCFRENSNFPFSNQKIITLVWCILLTRIENGTSFYIERRFVHNDNELTLY